MIKTYALLTKPGILLGNGVTTATGFLLASGTVIQFPLFFFTLLGLAAVIASACVINNVIDRKADQKMERTKDRALAKGEVTPNQALLFALALGVMGFLILALFTNTLATSSAAIGFFVYVCLYTVCKHHSDWGAVVGSVAGAMPPVVGYLAAGNDLNLGALLLFLILVLWQMPHFYAIALWRYDDYFKANIPVLPVARGKREALRHIVAYVVLFTLVSTLLYPAGFTGIGYFVGALLLSLIWLGISFKGFFQQDLKSWAKQMFVYSLVVINGLCLMMVLDKV
jgi:protoheme IX farnesyltransferase